MDKRPHQLPMHFALRANMMVDQIPTQGPAEARLLDYTIRTEHARNVPSGDVDFDDKIVYRVIPEPLITRSLLSQCAARFSLHYGVWGKAACWELGGWAMEGKRVLMTADRIKEQSLPRGANNVLICAVTGKEKTVGHCFVSQWEYGGQRVWWVTQLVVLPEYRSQRKATRMLQTLKIHYDVGKSEKKELVGVLSSHPYTILAVLRVFGRGIEELPSKDRWSMWSAGLQKKFHEPLRGNKCLAIMRSSPVKYVHDAILLRDYSARTRFYIDHTEQELALERVEYGMSQQLRKKWEWPFGDLREGCEFLCILEHQHDSEYNMEPQYPESCGRLPKMDFEE